MGDLQQTAFWEPTHIRGRPKKFSRQGDLLPGICASLTYGTSQQLGGGLLIAFVFGATTPTPPSGPAPPHSRGFYITTHNDEPQSVGLLWTSDQLVAQTSTWQHTTPKTDRHPCPRWDSNPQSHQASGRRSTPSTARPLGSAFVLCSWCKSKSWRWNRRDWICMKLRNRIIWFEEDVSVSSRT